MPVVIHHHGGKVGRAFQIKLYKEELNPYRIQHHSCAELLPYSHASIQALMPLFLSCYFLMGSYS